MISRQAILQLALLVFPVAHALDVVVCPIPVKTENSTNLDAEDPKFDDYNEISGLAMSPTQRGPSGQPIMFGINDSGGGKKLGIFDSGDGKRLLTLRLKPFPYSISDWESMAVGSCGSTGPDETCLYIGDIGDNKARGSPLGTKTQRKGTPYQIFKVREPQLATDQWTDGDSIPADHFSVLTYDYNHTSSPSMYADSEAMFMDPKGWAGAQGDLYIVTKWDHGKDALEMTRLFRIPATAWPTVMNGTVLPETTYSAVAVGNGAGHLKKMWTAADITLDGTVLAVSDLWNTYLFLRCPGESVAEALDTLEPCGNWSNPRSDTDKQFETFSWTPDGQKGLQMSETRGCCNPAMGWTTMAYDATKGRVCPEVKWSKKGNTWECRTVDTNTLKPDSWCTDRNLALPMENTPAPTPSTIVAAEDSPTPVVVDDGEPPAPDTEDTAVLSSGDPGDSLNTPQDAASSETSGSSTWVIGSLEKVLLLLVPGAVMMYL